MSIITINAEKAMNAAWAALRAKRDKLLEESDWTQLGDAPLDSDKKHLWKQYRQALRDLPGNTADPANPVWPKMPS